MNESTFDDTNTNENGTVERFSGRIFCIMGKSASGKDTLYRKISDKIAEAGADVLPIITYTTRPKRSGETEGAEYHFITDAALSSFTDAGLVVERRDYDTKYGIWSYATIHDGQIAGDNAYLVIQTPEGVKKLQEYYGEEHIVPIYVSVDNGIRLMRALLREMSQDEPKYDEMCRRYLSDTEDFAEVDAIASNGGDIDGRRVYKFVNDELAKCANNIADFILSSLADGANEA